METTGAVLGGQRNQCPFNFLASLINGNVGSGGAGVSTLELLTS